MIRGNKIFTTLFAIIMSFALIWLNNQSPVDSSDKDTESSVEAENAIHTTMADNDNNIVATNQVPTGQELSAQRDKTSFTDENKVKENTEETGSSETAPISSASNKKKKKASTKIKGEKALQLLSDSKVTSSSGYDEHFGDSVNVFAEDQSHCIGFRTAVSYNLWGNNVQQAVYSTAKIKKKGGKKLIFDIGAASGGNGSVTFAVYTDSSEKPVYVTTLNTEEEPQHVSVDIENAGSIKIVVNNQSSHENEIILFNLCISKK
ncbi:MAG: NPCBM/NEW2 domain-containing protein [Lachnospiraceae bacterium]